MTHDETTAHYVVGWAMSGGEGRVEFSVSDTPEGTFVEQVTITGRVRLGLFQCLDVGAEVAEMRRDVLKDQLDALRRASKRKLAKPLPMVSSNPEGETHDACA